VRESEIGREIESERERKIERKRYNDAE